ncbi:MAG: chemotaxis protein CheA [Treponema sp.]|nr:chemotaxis protein CheA [Treponema sp.]
MKIDANLFLGDFEAEARIHIEKIETAFLDVSLFAGDHKLMNSVFRAAHSLKGTAGFLSLDKIVAVTHELEGVLLQIKDEVLTIDNEIADIVLQCVDCLKDLVENLQNDEAISINEIIGTIKRYTHAANSNNNDESSGEVNIPFNFKDNETEKILKNMSKHGHKIYYINIGFNRSLGKYYHNPKGMIDNIFSIGLIVQAVVAGSGAVSSGAVSGKIMKNSDTAVFTGELIKALEEYDTSTIEFLITSILDLELFSIATGVDKKHIRLLSKKIIFGEDKINEKTKISGLVKSGQLAAADNDKKNKPAALQGNNLSIRLDITDINKLMDLANEMVLARNQLFSIVAEHKKTILGLTPLLHDINYLTSEIHEKIMFTRMQPISVIFNKFPRMIRDTAKALNKDIAVKILRDDVTLDKYLLEALADPITQLVKNSADHGMESAEQRTAAGKPQKGSIILNAYMHDGSAIIEVSDDGGGIDADALKKKAVEQGIETEEKLASMPKNEIYNLIFRPGISTAKQITNLSGRGVGMDIVKTNIEKSGGLIEVESELGVGTTVRLKMPLTLSIINTLIIKINSILYAVPELNVEHIVRINNNSSSKQRIEKINKSLVLSFNGRIIPIITMNEIEAKIKGASGIPAAKVLEKCLAAGVTKCLILRADGKSFALLIDDAVETEQILVKPLPVYLQNCPCYLCVTVLGSGRAVAILDAAGIMRFMNIEDKEKEAALYNGASLAQQLTQTDEKMEKNKYEENEKQIIIFKCSGTEYFAVETVNILRIESIKNKDIQEINKECFVNIAGVTWRLARPEDFAPVTKQDYTEEKLYVLTLKNNISPIGLLVRNVIDKAEGEFILDTKQLYSDFIFGTGIYNEKILIFLNPAAITGHVENDKESKKNTGKGKNI